MPQFSVAQKQDSITQYEMHYGGSFYSEAKLFGIVPAFECGNNTDLIGVSLGYGHFQFGEGTGGYTIGSLGALYSIRGKALLMKATGWTGGFALIIGGSLGMSFLSRLELDGNVLSHAIRPEIGYSFGPVIHVKYGRAFWLRSDPASLRNRNSLLVSLFISGT